LGCKQIESQRKQIKKLNENNEALIKANEAYNNSIEKLLEEKPYLTEHFKKFDLGINYSQFNNDNNIQNLITGPKDEIDDTTKFYDIIVPI